MNIWQITTFTLVTALAATALMIPIGLALAWLLARRQFRGRLLVETLVSLPLVMPPVATGLILLLFLHTWRSTLIVLVSIPVSLLATLALMAVLHYNLNLLTMVALVVSVGIQGHALL